MCDLTQEEVDFLIEFEKKYMVASPCPLSMEEYSAFCDEHLKKIPPDVLERSQAITMKQKANMVPFRFNPNYA